MSEKKGIATRILYQLYVALQRKDVSIICAACFYKSVSTGTE